MTEKPPVKNDERVEYFAPFVFFAESVLRQKENLCGAESAAHRIIQKKVVQFVGAQKFFRFLRDLTVFCRKQLRTYGCVYNVE